MLGTFLPARAFYRPPERRAKVGGLASFTFSGGYPRAEGPGAPGDPAGLPGGGVSALGVACPPWRRRGWRAGSLPDKAQYSTLRVLLVELGEVIFHRDRDARPRRTNGG